MAKLEQPSPVSTTPHLLQSSGCPAWVAAGGVGPVAVEADLLDAVEDEIRALVVGGSTDTPPSGSGSFEVQ